MSAHLFQADRLRDARIAQYASGVRLTGYEELQTHLEAVTVAFNSDRLLRKLTFLVIRARGDFQTCLEATLSGYPAVAKESMRDVMEIEFLLRDFYFEPTRITEWLECSDKERNDRFRPAVLRQRYAAHVGKQPQDLREAADYKGHSMLLHVSPYRNPFGGPGLVADDTPFGVDSCFWELFEHARRAVHALHFLSQVSGTALIEESADRMAANPNDADCLASNDASHKRGAGRDVDEQIIADCARWRALPLNGIGGRRKQQLPTTELECPRASTYNNRVRLLAC